MLPLTMLNAIGTVGPIAYNLNIFMIIPHIGLSRSEKVIVLRVWHVVVCHQFNKLIYNTRILDCLVLHLTTGGGF
jgi:hypothetical protein